METLFAVAAVALFCGAVWFFFIRTPESEENSDTITSYPNSRADRLQADGRANRSNSTTRQLREREGLDVEEVVDVVEDLAMAAHVAEGISELVHETVTAADGYSTQEIPAKTGLEISDEDSRKASDDHVPTRTTGLEISDDESRRVADTPVRESYTPPPSLPDPEPVRTRDFSAPSIDSSPSFSDSGSSSSFSDSGGGGGSFD